MASLPRQTARKTRSQQQAEINALADKTLAANIMRITPKEEPKAAGKQEKRKQNLRSKEDLKSPAPPQRVLRNQRIKSLEEGPNKATTTKSKLSRKRQQSNDETKLNVKLIAADQQENEQPTTGGKLNPSKGKQAGRMGTRKESCTSTTSTEEHEPHVKSKRSRKNSLPSVKVVDNKNEQLQLEANNQQLHNNNKSDLEPQTAIVKLATIKNISNNNNNDSDYIDIEAQQEYHRIVKHKTEELKALNDAMVVPPAEAAKVGYTHEQLKQFLLNSSLSHSFPEALRPNQSTSQLFRGFIASIYAMEQVQLDQLLDLYHLCIMMQHYEQMDTHSMGYRCQLLEAVCELASELQVEDADIIGISLCDRFVMGTGNARLERVIDMHCSIVQIIKSGDDVNRRIAMKMLLATFSKVSGQPIPESETDVLKQAFEMAQHVDWTKLVASGCVPDLFILVRSFALILNIQENRRPHVDWNKQLGSEMHKYFMTVLRTVRFSRNYNFFAMMVERYIAFCVVRGATARAHTTDTLPD